MTRLTKTILGIPALILLACLGSMAYVNHLHSKGNREINQLLAQLTPGVHLADVAPRLGKPGRTITNTQQIAQVVLGRKPGSLTNCTLHVFHYRSYLPAIVVYTEKTSGDVVHACTEDW